MKHYGLFGEHLGHSLSVPIHQAFFQETGIAGTYRLIELPRENFASGAARELQTLAGANVTIPYKRDIIPLLTSISSDAQEVGAVNTISITGGEMIGHNTDVPGFIAMLRHHGISPKGQPCFILGTGGASLAARAALEQMGAAFVMRVSRNPDAPELERCPDVISYADLPYVFSGVLVNCTPCGMFPHQNGCPLTDEALAAILPRATGVADMIYNPPETILTAAARSRGVPACTGLWMLVAQAIRAQEIWQNQSFPDDLVEVIVDKVQARGGKPPLS